MRPAAHRSSPSLSPAAPRSQRRRLVAAGAVLAVVVGVAGFVWFRPDRLFIDDRVSEELPLDVAASPAAAPAVVVPAPAGAQSPLTAASATPVAVVRGSFRSLEHTTTGTAEVYATSGGGRVLRLADLETSNGPDLRVLLSAAPLSGDFKGWDGDAVELGRLKGNIGSQNYEIPAGVDLGHHGRVVIWCERFSVGFGVADLGTGA